MRKPWTLKEWLLLTWFVSFAVYHMIAGILPLNLPGMTHYYPRLVRYPGYVVDFETAFTRPSLLVSIFLESFAAFLSPMNILLSAVVVFGIWLGTRPTRQRGLD